MPRKVLIPAAVVAMFALIVAAMLLLLPHPRRNVDYLVVGGMATMVAMGALFLILIRTTHKGSDVFFKRKKQ
jgi:hypothetical protein